MAVRTELVALEAVHVAMEDVKRSEIDRGAGVNSPVYRLAEQMQRETEQMTRLLEQGTR